MYRYKCEYEQFSESALTFQHTVQAKTKNSESTMKSFI